MCQSRINNPISFLWLWGKPSKGKHESFYRQTRGTSLTKFSEHGFSI